MPAKIRTRRHSLSHRTALALTLGAGCAQGAEGGGEGRALTPQGPADGPVVRAARTPPPISGGTLLVSSTGTHAVASDPDRGLVHLADLDSLQHVASLDVGHDEPGRLVEDGRGLVHVVLRSSGEIATIDVAQAEIVQRRRACPNPRGIDYDPAGDALWIACAEGTLVQMSADGAEIERWYVRPDLRDVIAPNSDGGEDGAGPLVTTFRDATVWSVDAAGTPMAHPRGDIATTPFASLSPTVAWRTRRHDEGGWVMVHQLATTDLVDLGTDGGGSPYNDVGEECNPNVGAGVSVRLPGGEVLMSPPMSHGVLPVDVAVNDIGTVAVVTAGADDGTDNLHLFSADDLAVSPGSRCEDGYSDNVPGQPVALEFAPDGRLVVQSREPALLAVYTEPGRGATLIPLSEQSAFDTGHELFHRDAALGVSCASCHPEGGDDGVTWEFAPGGPRRSQPLYVGLEGTEPFHWAGDLPDFASLFTEVHGRRMGGRLQSTERIEAVQDWLDTLSPPAPRRRGDEPAVQRGKAAFDAVGCATCHAGSNLTNAASVDMRASFAVQVPTLRAVGSRPPYMHDGRAKTLHDAVLDMLAFSTGGANATDQDVDDIVAYLESL